LCSHSAQDKPAGPPPMTGTTGPRGSLDRGIMPSSVARGPMVRQSEPACKPFRLIDAGRPGYA
jgi:hypothetical protein